MMVEQHPDPDRDPDDALTRLAPGALLDALAGQIDALAERLARTDGEAVADEVRAAARGVLAELAALVAAVEWSAELTEAESRLALAEAETPVSAILRTLTATVRERFGALGEPTRAKACAALLLVPCEDGEPDWDVLDELADALLGACAQTATETASAAACAPLLVLDARLRGLGRAPSPEPAPTPARGRPSTAARDDDELARLLQGFVDSGRVELARGNCRKLAAALADDLESGELDDLSGLIDWLVDRDEVDEVYLSPDELEAILARW